MFCSLLSYTGKKTGKSKLLRLFNRKLIWEICKREVFCIYQSVLSVQLICPLSRALSLFLFPYISPSTAWHSLKAAREVGGTTIKLCPLLSYLSHLSFFLSFSSSFLSYLFAFALFLFLLIAKSCCTQSKFSLLLHSTDIFTRGIKACTPLSLTLTLTLSLFLTLTLTHFPLSVTVSFTLTPTPSLSCLISSDYAHFCFWNCSPCRRRRRWWCWWCWWSATFPSSPHCQSYLVSRLSNTSVLRFESKPKKSPNFVPKKSIVSCFKVL